MVPGEDRSWGRYLLVLGLALSGVLWWIGPGLGLFLVDPMLQLNVNDIQARLGVAAAGDASPLYALHSASWMRYGQMPHTSPRAPSAAPLPPQVITPRTPCFDYKAPAQACDDAGVSNSYYLFNLTNPAEVRASSYTGLPACGQGCCSSPSPAL